MAVAEKHRKLLRFAVSVGDACEETPNCRKLLYSASFLDEFQNVIEQSECSTVFDGVLDDPEQIPWVIAHALRDLFVRKASLRSDKPTKSV